MNEASVKGLVLNPPRYRWSCTRFEIPREGVDEIRDDVAHEHFDEVLRGSPREEGREKGFAFKRAVMELKEEMLGEWGRSGASARRARGELRASRTSLGT